MVIGPKTIFGPLSGSLKVPQGSPKSFRLGPLFRSLIFVTNLITLPKWVLIALGVEFIVSFYCVMAILLVIG